MTEMVALSFEEGWWISMSFRRRKEEGRTEEGKPVKERESETMEWGWGRRKRSPKRWARARWKTEKD